jgi:hypothetical protein
MTKRLSIIIGLFILYFVIAMGIRFTPLFGLNAHTSLTHTLIQSIATILALFSGSAALYRYYSSENKPTMFLFLGVGFIGTAVIEAYHALVTMAWFQAAFPNIPSSVVEWSWFAARGYLSLFVLLSLWALHRSSAHSEIQIKPRTIYLSIGGLTLLSLIGFSLIRTPYPVYPNQFFCRPTEFAAGFLFLIALIGYLKEGSWKTDKLSFWMVLFLLSNVCAQFFYIGLSPYGFDTLYLTAHVVKIISYLMIYFAVSE